MHMQSVIDQLFCLCSDIPDIKKPKMLEGVRSFIVSAFHICLQSKFI